jgi:aspartate/methionine/tyrosine aminotransferase
VGAGFNERATIEEESSMTTLPIADRMARLGTETAFEVLVKARKLEAEGKHVVHLEIGEPDFDTPQHIKDAAVEALKQGYTHYGPSAGLPELRQAIVDYVRRSRGVAYDVDHVVVTPGAKPILFFALVACVNPGDEVMYPDPGFPIYESVTNFIDATPVPLALREERDFRLDVQELADKLTDRTRMIILNSPQNPTGSMLTKADVSAIADLVRGRTIVVLTDEVYCQMTYGQEHHSIASEPGMQEQAILLDGFSKTYAMTGWRLGYGLMEKNLAARIARLMTNSNSCTASFTQVAGIAALTGPHDDVHAMMDEFARRRQIIVDGLNAIPGISCRPPAGAFYAFANVKGVGMGTQAYADYLLNEAGVAVLSGTAFGQQGNGYIRLSYANSVENLREALRRIAQATQAIRATAGVAR